MVGCFLMWSSFYDDYIVFSPPSLARSAELTAGSVFKLLGWIFAEEGRKCKPFDLQCEALGVLFELGSSKAGVCHVTNTRSRIDEISMEILRLIEQGFVTQLEAQKLRGRMQFAESQIYGRTGKRCIGALKEFACRRRTNLLDREITFLKLFVSLLKLSLSQMLAMKESRVTEFVVLVEYFVILFQAPTVSFRASLMKNNEAC